MPDYVSIILVVCFFGWIPLLAFGKAIAMIGEAFRKTTEISVDTITVNTQSIENLDEDIIDKIVLNNVKK